MLTPCRKILFSRRLAAGHLLFAITTAVSLALATSLLPAPLEATTGDEPSFSNTAPAAENPEQLLIEAQQLFIENRPIDARSKLLKALQLAPSDFRPHMLLGAYYLSEVAHFHLAYRYLRTAETLFEKRYGSAEAGTLPPEQRPEHARLLYLLSEAELNLDKYQKALDTLDRFQQFYRGDWYPGARAWILMKLKRIDEAIAVAQVGLLGGAELGRTYNILGILLSLKDNRELSLDAFARAIRSEVLLGGGGQVATPLNNAGEVYREMFRDDMAESAWVRAIRLPDGCEHILPSLNLAILYIDQLRLLEAERTLSNFESCFAEKSNIREDSEHRALLALARGRIALRKGDPDAALEFLRQASDRQQWFGKIGTNENDVRLAATISIAQASAAKARVVNGSFPARIWEHGTVWGEIVWYKLRSWWFGKRAREIAVEELSDFEDLPLRNTDTMLEYPTLGEVLSGFPRRSLELRIERLASQDKRQLASAHYQLYLGLNYLAHGDPGRAASTLNQVLTQLRPQIDRLARAEAIAGLLSATEQSRYFWQRYLWREESSEQRTTRQHRAEELFELLPSHLRYWEIRLPTAVTIAATTHQGEKLLRRLTKKLAANSFELADSDGLRYEIRITESTKAPEGELDQLSVKLELIDRLAGGTLVSLSGVTDGSRRTQSELLNRFVAEVFSHRLDPAGPPLPRLEILDAALGKRE